MVHNTDYSGQKVNKSFSLSPMQYNYSGVHSLLSSEKVSNSLLSSAFQTYSFYRITLISSLAKLIPDLVSLAEHGHMNI